MAERPLRGVRGGLTGDGNQVEDLLRGELGGTPTAGRIAEDLDQARLQGAIVLLRFHGGQGGFRLRPSPTPLAHHGSRHPQTLDELLVAAAVGRCEDNRGSLDQPLRGPGGPNEFAEQLPLSHRHANALSEGTRHAINSPI
jgi:hypothetical protein